MVHGILQFTPSIAVRYVLHRCESRDIRCRESFLFIQVPVALLCTPRTACREAGHPFFCFPWRFYAPGVVCVHDERPVVDAVLGAPVRGFPLLGRPWLNMFSGRLLRRIRQ
jgi:hypothetical protein